MINFLLSLFSLGQSTKQKSEERSEKAASYLSNIERICLESDVRLEYEIRRISRLVRNYPVEEEAALQPLRNMKRQVAQLMDQVSSCRKELRKKGSNSEILQRLEQCAGTCEVMPTQIELAVRYIEEVLTANPPE